MWQWAKRRKSYPAIFVWFPLRIQDTLLKYGKSFHLFFNFWVYIISYYNFWVYIIISYLVLIALCYAGPGHHRYPTRSAVYASVYYTSKHGPHVPIESFPPCDRR